MSVWDGFQVSFGAFLFLATLGALWWALETLEDAIRRRKKHRERKRSRDRC